MKEHLIIRRLRCQNCHAYHNELPDCLVPHKHYDAETISGVLDGTVTPDDRDAEDYPCLQTMLRWLAWLNLNLASMEGSLRRAGRDIFRLGNEILFSSQSVLNVIRESCPDWLEGTLRIIYNSGGALRPLH